MKVSKRKLLYGSLFILILYVNILSQYVHFLGYLDEIIAIASILYVLTHLRKIDKELFAMLAIIGLMTAIALAGNVIFQYQDSSIAILKDILAFYKLPMTFIALYTWSRNKNLNDAHDVAAKISEISTIVMFIGCVISVFTDIGLSYGVRHGFRTYKFLYSHPTYLVYAFVLISVVLVSEQEKHIKKRKKYYVLHFMVLFCILFSFRDKGFGYIALFFVIMVLLPRRKKVKMRYFVIAGIIALLASYQKLLEYKSWSWSPRNALYMNGLQLALRVFPLGSGFATFNSFLSGEYYSKAYYLFGLERKPGLNPIDYVDAGDAQLPYYYTQFGFIGFILFAVALYLLVKKVKKIYQGRTMVLKSAYLLMGYMVIGALVEAVFTNETGVTSIVVLLLYLNCNNENSRQLRKEKYGYIR